MAFFIKDIINELEISVPLDLRERWDNSGYQIKLENEPLNGVLISLDLTSTAVSMAVKKNCNLILIHHPFFFYPVSSLDINSVDSKIISDLLTNRICVYAMHTNFDSSFNSMSRYIAEKAGLSDIATLKPGKKRLYKLSVFVPKGYVSTVRETLFAFANPKIGNYENCSFETKGRGSFKPLLGAKPFIGKKEKTSFVEESKLELIVDENRLGKAVEEMKKVHPYEEVAFDVYPLANCGKNNLEGIGVVGKFKSPVKLKELLGRLNKLIKPAYINYVGDAGRLLKRAAIISGSGFSLINEVIRQKIDILISSECSYDKALKAKKNNLCLIDLPHFDTEKYFISIVKGILRDKFSIKIKIVENNIDINPIINFKGEKA